MNSWKSTELSACAPPLRTFIIGTGRTCARVAAEVAPQRQPLLGRGRVRGGQRDAEDRVGAEARLVRRAVELDQRAVERRPGRSASSPATASAISPLTLADRLRDALAAVGVAAVAQLGGLELAGRRARRAPRRGRSRRSAARARPRPSGCPGCRGSGGRGPSRSCSSALVQPCCACTGTSCCVGGQLAPARRPTRAASASARLDAAAEAVGGGAQRELGVDLQLARHVDGGEEHVADLVEGVLAVGPAASSSSSSALTAS